MTRLLLAGIVGALVVWARRLKRELADIAEQERIADLDYWGGQ